MPVALVWRSLCLTMVRHSGIHVRLRFRAMAMCLPTQPRSAKQGSPTLAKDRFARLREKNGTLGPGLHTAKRPVRALALSNDGHVMLTGEEYERAFRYVSSGTPGAANALWKPSAELKPTGMGLGFGASVTLSADGSRAAIGAPEEGVAKRVVNKDGS
jgi:hypothetical protein